MSKANETQVGGGHYKTSPIQHWDWSWASAHDPFQYQITKYVDRHKRKNGLQDLRKAQHFLEKYIELCYLDPPCDCGATDNPTRTGHFMGCASQTGVQPGGGYVRQD